MKNKTIISACIIFLILPLLVMAQDFEDDVDDEAPAQEASIDLCTPLLITGGILIGYMALKSNFSSTQSKVENKNSH